MECLKVSKVIHLTNITHNISRFDIIDVVEKVATVKEVFILRPNNQALVEFYTLNDAIAVMETFKVQKMRIFNNEVDIRYSRHEQLIKPEDQVAPQCVLLVSIICCDNSSLSLQYFYSICSKFGFVERIRMFIHQAGPQALVQYSHLYDCIRAKGELEKESFIFNGKRYSFEVQFSKLKELVIQKNNNYSRDFRMYPMECVYVSNYNAMQPALSGYGNDPLDAYNASTASLESEGMSSSPSSSPQLFHMSSDHGYSLSSYSHNGSDALSQSSISLLQSRRSSSLFAQEEYTPLNYHSSLLHRDSSSSFLSNSSSLTEQVNHHNITYNFNTADYTPSLSSPFGRGDGFAHSSLPFASQTALRKYVLDGFSSLVPISDLVDLLYGIDIKYAEYKSDATYDGSVSVNVYGVSEWSDSMLSSYLRCNAVNGKIIRLHCPSELVNPAQIPSLRYV